MNRNVRVNLSSQELVQISELFKRKGWNEPQLFDRFCQRISQLKSPDERKLILELSERFLLLPLSKYSEYLIPALNNLLKWAPKGHQLLFMNGIPSQQYGYVKSNYLVTYQLKASTIKRTISQGNNAFYVLNGIKDLLRINDLSNKCLVLTDDFIGSGETIELAFLYIQNRLKAHNKSMPKCAVLSIVAMENASKRLGMSLSVPVFCSVLQSRGISDYYKGDQLDNAKFVMSAIETSLKVKPSFKFGYGQTEALVCMERCPNNTFPVFWKNKYAPYER